MTVRVGGGGGVDSGTFLELVLVDLVVGGGVEVVECEEEWRGWERADGGWRGLCRG